MTKNRDKHGSFIRSGDRKQDMTNRSNAAKDMYGMGNLKNQGDYNQKLLEVTGQAMTKLGTARAEKAQKSLEKTINFQSDFAEIYSPSQNFMNENASGGDAYAEGGRIPLNELVAMTQYRIGWAYRATYGKAQAIYRNGYEFVPEDFDIDTESVEQKEIKNYFDQVDWFSFRIQHLFREKQTGLGIGVFAYPGEKREDMMEEIDFSKMKNRPDRLKAYSAWHLVPNNFLHYELGDYDKSKWDFRGGIVSTLFNHTRISLLETKPEPFHLRGLSEIEPIWTPAICYFNTMIFVLKTLAQVGVTSIGIQSPNEFPTKKEADSYLELLNSFRANKFYLLGAGATLVTQNMASQIGKGLADFIEFLKEDISSRLVMPKNQLFGRSEGGGLDGAGALVSKDDMLAEFMAEALDMTSEELAFLRGPCKFEKHLEGLTLRWRLDLHKTEMERLQEEALRIDMKMKRQMADQAEKQMKMNNMLMDEQMEQIKRDPKGFLDKMNTEVEQNTQEGVKNKPEENKTKKPPKSDFMQYYRDIKYKFGGPLDRMFKPRKVDEDL